MCCDVPVLLVVFNRPEKARILIDALREVRPVNIFIAADGPRVHRLDDAEKCAAVRQAICNIDWECRIETRFHQNNLGCDVNVPDAINWFFEHVEYGIILEDDCIPDPIFFSFCDELLRRYASDNRILQISSISPYLPRVSEADYHFSRSFRCWAWGTWRRAWLYYQDYVELLNEDDMHEMFRSSEFDPLKLRDLLIKYWEFKQGRRANWDFLWNMACYSQNGLCIVPEVNLSRNIGFDADATHTTCDNPFFSNLSPGHLSFPLAHPRFVFADHRPEDSLVRQELRNLSLKRRLGWVYRQLLQFVGGLEISRIFK